MNESIVKIITNVRQYATQVNQDMDHMENIVIKSFPKIIEKTQNKMNSSHLETVVQEILQETIANQYDIWVIFINDRPVSYTFTHHLARQRIHRFAEKIKQYKFQNDPTVEYTTEYINKDELIVKGRSLQPIYLTQPNQTFAYIHIEPVSNTK